MPSRMWVTTCSCLLCMILHISITREVSAAFVKNLWQIGQRRTTSFYQLQFEGNMNLDKQDTIATIDKISNSQQTKYVGRQQSNKNAQQVFSLITERYYNKVTEVGIDWNSNEWKKAKRYIYHATSSSSSKYPLSITQVVAVLDFLDDTFGIPNSMDSSSDSASGTQNSTIDSVFIFRSVPRILRKDVDRYLRPTVDFLRELYGPMFYQYVKRRPDLVITSGVGYNRKYERNKASVSEEEALLPAKGSKEGVVLELDIEKYLENLSLSPKQISDLKIKHPTMFDMSPSKFDDTVNYLLTVLQVESSDHFSDGHAIVGKMIMANPKILNLSLKNLRAKIDFLSEIGFDSGESLRLLLKKYPGILGLSLDHNLRPTTNTLLELCEKEAVRLESSNKQGMVKKIISLHPQLLALSPKNFAAKIDYFDKKLVDYSADDPYSKKSKRSLALKILMTAPSVYSLSLENIQQKVSCLSDLWSSNVSHSSIVRASFVAKQISDFPAVLTLSLEANIKPTISFYNRTGYILQEEPMTKVAPLPGRYLAASLYNRLLPRWHYFLKFYYDSKGTEDHDKSTSQDTGNNHNCRPPLHLLAGASDDTFCAKMNYSYDDYIKFKKEAIPILKFNSQFDMWINTGRPIDIDE